VKFLAIVVLALFPSLKVEAEEPRAIDEEKVAAKLAELTLACRYDGPQEELLQQWRSIILQREASKKLPTPDEKAEFSALSARLDEENKRIAPTSKARIDLAIELDRLAFSHNPAAIKLVAPLLGEHSKVFKEDDYTNPGAEQRAADALGAMVDTKVTIPDAPANRYDPDAWRQWWATHRATYEPIPAPLLALEENQRQYYGQKTATPPPSNPQAPLDAAPQPASSLACASKRPPVR